MATRVGSVLIVLLVAALVWAAGVTAGNPPPEPGGAPTITKIPTNAPTLPCGKRYYGVGPPGSSSWFLVQNVPSQGHTTVNTRYFPVTDQNKGGGVGVGVYIPTVQNVGTTGTIEVTVQYYTDDPNRPGGIGFDPTIPPTLTVGPGIPVFLAHTNGPALVQIGNGTPNGAPQGNLYWTGGVPQPQRPMYFNFYNLSLYSVEYAMWNSCPPTIP